MSYLSMFEEPTQESLDAIQQEALERYELDCKRLEIMQDIPLDRLHAIAEAENMIGKTVYRITTPYRGVPKVTPYLVKNYRTTSKKHKIMFEVCAVGVGVMNVMSLKQFYLTREAAEAALSEGKGE